VDRLGALEKRHCVCNGTSSGPPAVPAHDDAIESEPAALDIGNEEERTSRLEQHRLNQQLLGRAVLALRLAHNCKVETPCDGAEDGRAAADTGVEHARLG